METVESVSMQVETPQSRLLGAQQEIEARAVHPTGVWEGFPQAETEQSIPARFEKMAALYPERLAVKSRAFEFTYAQLNSAGDRCLSD